MKIKVSLTKTTKKEKILGLLAVIVLILIFIFFKTKNENNKTENGKTKIEEKIEEKKDDYRELNDMDYKNLIAGDFTKEEFLKILPYITEGLVENPNNSMSSFLTVLSQKNIIETNHTKDYKTYFSLNDVNKIISIFTEKQFNKDNVPNGFEISEDKNSILFSPPTIPVNIEINVKETTFSENENVMKILYDYKSTFFDAGNGKRIEEKNLIANFEISSDGKYRISKIEQTNKSSLKEEKKEKKEMDVEIQKIYQDIVNSFRENNGKYGKFIESTGEFFYSIIDVNKDNVKDLIVFTKFKDGKFIVTAGKVFSFKNGQLKEFKNKTFNENIIYANRFIISKENNNLYSTEFYPGTGKMIIYEINLDFENEEIIKKEFKEFRIDKEKNFFDSYFDIETKKIDEKINLN